MIATQLLFAQGAQAMPKYKREEPRVMCSPRKVLLEIRREMTPWPRRRCQSFSKRLKTCGREQRERTSPKTSRVWPRRKDHQPPGPPQILTLTPTQKCLLSRCQKVA